MTDNTLHILLVDDNKNEHIFFTHALKYIGVSFKLSGLTGGLQLMKYLKEDSNPLPDILFLDVNMPIKNGIDCLTEIRADDRYRDMPIVMYSTSDAPKDTDVTYQLGADLYVQKPVEIEDLVSMLSSVLDAYRHNQLLNNSRENYVLTLSKK